MHQNSSIKMSVADIMASDCAFQLHVGTIFFMYHCADGSEHPLTDEKRCNQANYHYSSAEEDSISVYMLPCHKHSLFTIGRCLLLCDDAVQFSREKIEKAFAHNAAQRKVIKMITNHVIIPRRRPG